MVKTKRLKHRIPYLKLQSFFNSSACNCFEGLYVLSGKRTKLYDKHFVYWFILYQISSPLELSYIHFYRYNG